MRSPTQRTQELLRRLGYIVANTERWNPYARVRQDLFGFIDSMAVSHDWLLFIQSTTGTNHSKRVKKIEASPAFPLLARHGDVQVWSWTKKGARGKRKVWKVRKESLPRHVLD